MKESKFIKEYWNNQGQIYKESHWASWGDYYMIELEIELISKQLENHDLVLDVGCANGYSTFEIFQRNKTLQLKGVDLSEEMIRIANLKLKHETGLNNSIQFEVGDICNLKFDKSIFNKVFTTRVLINLPNWEDQKKGISELIRVTKKGGKVIICEAFWEPLVLLNSLRSLKNLPVLEEHDFNRYLKVKKLENFLTDLGVRFSRVDFSSVYYLGSRFLRELVTDITQYEGYSNPINKIFFELEKDFSGGGFGIQQAYIIEVL
jgi:ubiquinone/menaquinone biosynthesis C-methylase UbiE